jgi:hypothetical protein
MGPTIVVSAQICNDDHDGKACLHLETHSIHDFATRSRFE